MNKRSKEPWNLKIDPNYRPSIAILVPVHNEAKTIRLKLENLRRVEYLSEKTEIVVVNDASEDETMAELTRFIQAHPFLRINAFDSKEHVGKTECLNRALNSINADVVIISDADCFWPSDILQKGLPFLSDRSVGAITAREFLLNTQGSWVTSGEKFYDNTVQLIRMGESKVHSTIIFQGGFAAYKRSLITQFDYETDDSGTAFDIVQKGSRALLIPELRFYTTFPTIWKNKINLKLRRASQLQHLWSKCLTLLFKRKLLIPKQIAIPEIFMHIFNPLLFFVIGFLSLLVFFQTPLILLAFVLVFSSALVVRKSRTIIIEAFQSNLILLIALPSFFMNKSFKLWKTGQESRYLITESALKAEGLL